MSQCGSACALEQQDWVLSPVPDRRTRLRQEPQKDIRQESITCVSPLAARKHTPKIATEEEVWFRGLSPGDVHDGDPRARPVIMMPRAGTQPSAPMVPQVVARLSGLRPSTSGDVQALLSQRLNERWVRGLALEPATPPLLQVLY